MEGRQGVWSQGRPKARRVRAVALLSQRYGRSPQEVWVARTPQPSQSQRRRPGLRRLLRRARHRSTYPQRGGLHSGFDRDGKDCYCHPASGRNLAQLLPSPRTHRKPRLRRARSHTATAAFSRALLKGTRGSRRAAAVLAECIGLFGHTPKRHGTRPRGNLSLLCRHLGARSPRRRAREASRVCPGQVLLRRGSVGGKRLGVCLGARRANRSRGRDRRQCCCRRQARHHEPGARKGRRVAHGRTERLGRARAPRLPGDGHAGKDLGRCAPLLQVGQGP